MGEELIKIGEVKVHYNASFSRVLRYSVEIFHKGLNEHKLISAPDIPILENKTNLQVNKWQGKWQAIVLRQQTYNSRQDNQDLANIKTLEAQRALKQIDDLLNHTLSINDTVNWETIKKKDNFPEKKPIKPYPYAHKEVPSKPEKIPFIEELKFTFLEQLIKSKKEKKIREYEQRAKDHEELYSDTLLKWETEKEQVEGFNLKVEQDHKNELKEWEKEVSKWEKRKDEFIQTQAAYNLKIDELKSLYLKKDRDSVIEYCEMVLNNSEYPDTFPKDFEVDYNPETSILIIEYQLPSLECFPKVKEVKFIASKNELKELCLTDVQLDKMFDEAIYKITLRTLHELFEADAANALMAISFNGWVTATNKATGKEETNCILSIQVNKTIFLDIDLSKVDPKVCFKTLKGVASSKLSSLTPVQPILQISKVDKRFVESYSVTGEIDDSTNIAAMNWEDFEHLIREIFEKEFSTNGGEVKVTRASRDGGVDAVVFDPDPIRGGKIVIQAKRYTNTVGVSAVRDLYGTVMNEGATKGILVTTADYGPDAYEFAKGKPLTLLNGSNLLHLLERHGHHAKIDLREAKTVFDLTNSFHPH